jgi:hypothetical protein
MRYLLMIYEAEPMGAPSDAEWAAVLGEYTEATRWMQERGWTRAAEALQPVATATTVSVRDGRRIVTDGPFAETKEQLGGFYLVDVPSLDDALECAARIPGARTGRIEVRPIMELG